MKSLSLTARISLSFAAGATLVLLGLGWIVARSMDAHFLEIDRDEIGGKLSLVQNLLAEADTPYDLDALPGRLDDALVGHHGLSVVLLKEDGSVWFASHSEGSPTALLSQANSGDGILTWEEKGRIYRGIKTPVAIGTGGTMRLTAAIALDITPHRLFRNEFLTLLVVATALAALITAALGWLVTRVGLSPLRRMTALATRLSASHLNERIPEARLPVEIRSPATAFNAMLGRLESSFRRLSEFSSDIAHELRTPISNLMTQTQVALSRTRSAEEYREILYSSLEEYQRLAAMIADMLFLAKADNGLIIPSREQVDLAAEIRDLFTFYEALAEEQGIVLAAHGAGFVTGDRLMLRRALSNLLSNAIRHTPRGGTVKVEVKSGDDYVAVSVENPGEPIPPEHLPRIFDRFYRIDPSRQRSSEGAGLGLAITQSIVQAHGGEIRVRSDATTCFDLRLPRG